MAFAIEHKTKIPYVIGTNQHGELGLSKEELGGDALSLALDTDSRKTFIVQEALKEKPVEMAALGKSGFVLAIGTVINPGGKPEESVEEAESQNHHQEDL